MSFEVSELKDLNVSELKSVLKDLELYKTLKKQLWKRWVLEYKKIKTGEKTLLVEYFSALDKEFVLEQAKEIYTTVFNVENIDKSKIELIEKPSAQWGMRIFLDDKVLDLSYSKIANKFF